MSRKARDRPDPSPQSMPCFRLPLPLFPYRFDLLLAIVGRVAHPARMIVRGEKLWRVTAGHLTGCQQVGQVLVITCPGARPGDEERIRAGIGRVLGTDHDVTPFYDFIAHDDRLRGAIGPVAGLPLNCVETVFEALITLIIEQHISWNAAMRAQQWLLQACGRRYETGHDAVYDFPTPLQIAGMRPAALKPMKITHQRINRIIRIARDVSDGRLNLESIRAMEPGRLIDSCWPSTASDTGQPPIYWAAPRAAILSSATMMSPCRLRPRII